MRRQRESLRKRQPRKLNSAKMMIVQPLSLLSHQMLMREMRKQRKRRRRAINKYPSQEMEVSLMFIAGVKPLRS